MNTQLALREDDPLATLFAPVPEDQVTGLLERYAVDKDRCEQVAAVFSGDLLSVVSYFIEGNGSDDRYTTTGVLAARLFKLEGALAALNAKYWSQALALTDVLDCMPQARRDEWYESIRERTTVPFAPTTVFATLKDLLASRHKFFAERVDGIFRSLSGEHVTNSPGGFRKRMILDCVLDRDGHANGSKAGVINDLRAVIAQLSGRAQPTRNATTPVINDARNYSDGAWVSLDGGALRLKVHGGVCTAHLEVHPDIAHKLNCVLASMHPRAVSDGLRKRPAKRKLKDFVMLKRPLPFEVLDALNDTRPRGNNRHVTISVLTQCGRDKRVFAEVGRVLASVGGVLKGNNSYTYYFDYEPAEVLAEIYASGCVPDAKAHQYYPTPASIAARAVELADIGPDHSCLEPSAGQGAIACLLPPERTVCIEISKLHCEVLKARGCETVLVADFMKCAPKSTGPGSPGAKAEHWIHGPAGFDRIVMNPPFADGRWLAHLEHAAGMLAEGGVLVAVLPASVMLKDVLPRSEWSLTWSEVIANEFAGTSVNVVLLRAEKSTC